MSTDREPTVSIPWPWAKDEWGEGERAEERRIRRCGCRDFRQVRLIAVQVFDGRWNGAIDGFILLRGLRRPFEDVDGTKASSILSNGKSSPEENLAGRDSKLGAWRYIYGRERERGLDGLRVFCGSCYEVWPCNLGSCVSNEQNCDDTWREFYWNREFFVYLFIYLWLKLSSNRKDWN